MSQSSLFGFRLLAILLVCGIALGQNSITFTTPTTIGVSNLTYEGYDITVSNTTVTIDGAHSFNSLVLVNGGVVNHSPGEPMHLTIATNVTVNSGCRIDVSGRGYSWLVNGGGPGGGASSGSVTGAGGSYGGSGGRLNSPPLLEAYGSFSQPADMGSAGGNYTGNLGGAGGGAVRLTVAGTLRVDGTISSNGMQGQQYCGGGSGGSVWVEAQTMAGLGLVEALGGATGPGSGGGGGGGRISLNTSINLFFGQVRSWGGSGYIATDGGSGTIFRRQVGQALGDLTLSNEGRNAHRPTVFSGQLLVRDLLIENNAILGCNEGDPALHVVVTRDCIIRPSASISVTGNGYSWPVNGGGPGGGASSGNTTGAGGSHGGSGGSYTVPPALTSYGSYSQPVEMGSAGGNFTGNLGGAGGGVIRLTVAGVLRVDGTIASNGLQGQQNCGGGSGGSIWIEAGTMLGLGLVEARGGSNGPGSGGGGGGGRIAVWFTTNSFQGEIRAWGGPGYVATDGGAGTIFMKNQSQPWGDLVLDNQGRNAHSTTDFTSTVQVRDLIIRNNAILSHVAGDDTLELDVRGNCRIETSGSIDLRNRGFGPAQGPGAGVSTGTNAGGGGGGHGGLGGRSGANRAGGFMYGSTTQPVSLGSGGGNGQLPNFGGAGGGKVKMTVAGTLTLNGIITADGSSAPWAINSGFGGGGSAGSIWITTGSLTGGGQLTARGGWGVNSGNSLAGGGGSGGRIAIDSMNTGGFIGAIEVQGGSGAQAGANGSYYLSSQPQYTHNVLNLSAGGLASFEVVGATPQALQMFTISFTGTGNTAIPGYFTLGLDQPIVLGFAQANSSGIANVMVALPGGASGLRIWSQPVESHPVTAAFRLANVVGRIVQ